MAEVLTAVCSAALVAACATGVGSVLCFPGRDLSPSRRWVLRLVLGLGLWPFLLLSAHEILGLRVRPGFAIAVAGLGLILAGYQERRWRSGNHARDRGELALVIAIGLGFAALAGLLGQPGFEFLDPWRHAFGAAWIADSGLLRQPDPSFPLVHYVDAYPPLFDLLLAVPVSIFGAVAPAAKGVAALLVAVAPLALWSLARSIFDDARGAAYATIIYAVMPSAVPRHLWGHSLAVVLILGGLTAAAELRRDRRWWPVLALGFGCAVLAAPSQGIKGGALLMAAVVVAAIVDRQWAGRLIAGAAAALAVSAIWFLPAASRWGMDPTALMRQMQAPELRRNNDPVSALGPDTAAPLPWAPKPHDRVPISDLIFLRPFGWLTTPDGGKTVNAIIPAGVGLPALLLVVAGLLPRREGKRDPGRWLATSWMLAAAVLTLGAPLGVVFFPWRSWLLLTPAVCLVAAFGLLRLHHVPRPWPQVVVLVAVAQAILAVCFDIGHGVVSTELSSPAWLVALAACVVWIIRLAAAGNPATERWLISTLLASQLVVASPVRATTLLSPMPPRVFYNAAEHRGYLELAATLPHGERVWPLSGGLRFDILVTLGLGCTPYRNGELPMARRVSRGELPTVDELLRFMEQYDYRWLVVDPSGVELQQALGATEAVPSLRRALVATPHFRIAGMEPPAHQFMLLERIEPPPSRQ